MVEVMFEVIMFENFLELMSDIIYRRILIILVIF